MATHVFPIDWRCGDVIDLAREQIGDRVGACDEEDDTDDTEDAYTQFEVACYGKTMEGERVCVRIAFPPYFFAEVPRDWSGMRTTSFLRDMCSSLGADPALSTEVWRTTMWGFTQNIKRRMVQLVFPSLRAMRRARVAVSRQHRMPTFEGTMDPLIKFFHVRDISPSGWLTVRDGRVIAPHVMATSFMDVGPCALSPLPVPPIVLASWDIETYSASGAFPKATNIEDVICAIGTTFQRVGDDAPCARHAVVLGGCDPIDGVDVVRCETEAEVISSWMDAIKQHGADVLVAWNSFGFDYAYVYNRARMLIDPQTLCPVVQLDRLDTTYGIATTRKPSTSPAFARKRVEPGDLVTRELSSAAYGANMFQWIDAPGLFHLDLMVYMKKEYKLDSYALGNVSSHFLDDTKLDLSPAELFAKVRGSDTDRADIVRYCVRDTELPLRLMKKLSMWPNLTEMANATSVPIDALITRGQQIKVFSLLMKKARSLGFVMPDTMRASTDASADSYVGATVLDAHTGAYLDDIVCALDFASLYPSIIRAHNMCPSTLVMDPRFDDVDGVDGVDGVAYYRVETPGGTFSFAQDVPSVLPGLLDDLAAFRAAAKAAMSDAKRRGDTHEASIQNGRQLAYKVSMNSAYGFFGASAGFMPCLPLAMSVTSTGRAMIQRTKEMVESLIPGSRVVYGDTDSVMCIFYVGEDSRLDMRAHFEVAERVAAEISRAFPPPNELEFEKAYHPYLLFSKKRYCGMMYTVPEAPEYMDVKGLQLVRRDSCPLVRRISKHVLDVIMEAKSVDAAYDIAKSYVVSFLRDEIPMDQLVVSKALRTEYKNPASQPHVQVALKIGERRGYPVPSGVRVPFVFVDDPANPDGLQASRAEDPEYVVASNLRIDRLHYIQSQISGPLETLLDILEKGTFARLLNDPDVAPLYDQLRRDRNEHVKDARRVRTNTVNRQREITDFLFRD